MSDIFLTNEQKALLEARHRVERDGRIRDRIKAVLLHSEGWKNEQSSQALRIRPETVSDHLRDYRTEEKLKPENGGSTSHLDEVQTMELLVHLEDITYMRVADICHYVLAHYGVGCSVSGMTRWLHRHGFSYKYPKGVPRKADPAKQQEFRDKYEAVKCSLVLSPLLCGPYLDCHLLLLLHVGRP